MKIEILNWEKYNPRKDIKATTWLRLQNNIFEDSDFYSLSHEQICFWIYLMTLASKKQSGSFFLNMDHALRIGRFKESTVLASLEYLEKIELLTFERHVDVTQTSRERNVDVTLRTNERTNEHTCIVEVPQYDFDSLYQQYPKRAKGNMGKKTGMTRLKKKIQSPSKYQTLERAVKNIKRMVDDGELDKNFIPMWATFANSYEDYLPENNEKAERSVFDTY